VDRPHPLPAGDKDIKPPSYELAILAYNTPVYVLNEETKTIISSSYNAPKIIIALVQTVSACVTLYQTRGDQIRRYGYAAYGLTVLPYAMMSVVNLIGSLVMPDYPTLYLVRSRTMCEAETFGEEFDGVVGTINNPNGKPDESSKPRWWNIWTASIACIIFVPIPFVLIHCLTNFHPGKSAVTQRFWLMSWLTLGVVGGFQPFCRTIGILLFGLFTFIVSLGEKLGSKDDREINNWLEEHFGKKNEKAEVKNIPWITPCIRWVEQVNSKLAKFVTWLLTSNTFFITCIGWFNTFARWLLRYCFAPLAKISVLNIIIGKFVQWLGNIDKKDKFGNFIHRATYAMFAFCHYSLLEDLLLLVR